jgi:DNA polymerase I-like protein with 3'-5' exonuclease and polymerase domains
MSCIAIDTETTGLELRNGCRAFMVSAFDEAGTEFLWEWKVNPHTRQPIVPKTHIGQINRLIKRYKRCIFHHYKFDRLALKLAGVDVSLLDDRFEDVQLLSHVVSSNESHGLKDLAAKYLDIPADDEKELRKAVADARRYVKKHHPDWLQGADVGCDYWLPRACWPENDICRQYAITDVKRTLFLWFLFSEIATESNLLKPYEREKRLLPAIIRMEDRGISLINDSLEVERKRYTEIALKHEVKCVELARKHGVEDLNIRSWQQILKITNETFKQKLTGTDFDTLTAFVKDKEDRGIETPATMLIWHLLENRQNHTAAKYLTNYEHYKIKDGNGVYRLSPNVNQTGTNTTRCSHSNPNNANVGKGDDDDEDTGEEGDFKLRSVFGPVGYQSKQGALTRFIKRVWYPIDYQQLQLRIFAYCADDLSMIRAFERGYNFHNFVASQIYKCEPEEVTKNQKRIGKNVNFGFIFGASPSKIEKTAGIPGLWDTVVACFPKAISFMAKMKAIARKQGYILTPGGYRLDIPRDKKGQVKAYIATNYFVQGAEGDIVKDAMIDLDQQLYSPAWQPYDTFLSMQVHDELVFDAPVLPPEKERKLLTMISNTMETAGARFGIVTPVTLSKTTTNWAEAEEISL